MSPSHHRRPPDRKGAVGISHTPSGTALAHGYPFWRGGTHQGMDAIC